MLLCSHLYIVVINSDVISKTKRMISSAKDITTQELLEETMKNSSLYYIAAVVNSSQYVDGYRMGYILGAEDYTVDADGHLFYNKKIRSGLKYFFRVFSVSSTQEVQKSYNLLYFYITKIYIHD